MLPTHFVELLFIAFQRDHMIDVMLNALRQLTGWLDGLVWPVIVVCSLVPSLSTVSTYPSIGFLGIYHNDVGRH